MILTELQLGEQYYMSFIHVRSPQQFNHNNRKYVIEQPCVIAQRHNFLRKVCKCCREGRPIIYLDETWLNAHHSLTKCWIDNDGTGRLPVKSGKGGRVIILHAG